MISFYIIVWIVCSALSLWWFIDDWRENADIDGLTLLVLGLPSILGPFTLVTIIIVELIRKIFFSSWMTKIYFRKKD